MSDVFTVPSIEEILEAVEAEVASATAQHGPMTGAHEAYAVIAEELDEFWDEVKKNPAKLNLLLRAEREQKMRKELIQTAAMAVRAIYDLGL